MGKEAAFIWRRKAKARIVDDYDVFFISGKAINGLMKVIGSKLIVASLMIVTLSKYDSSAFCKALRSSKLRSISGLDTKKPNLEFSKKSTIKGKELNKIPNDLRGW